MIELFIHHDVIGNNYCIIYLSVTMHDNNSLHIQDYKIINLKIIDLIYILHNYHIVYDIV